MSAVDYIVRILVLAAICSGVAFADGHPGHYVSHFERRMGKALNTQTAYEFEPTIITLPQIESFGSPLPNRVKNALSLESFEQQTPSIQIALRPKLATFAPHPSTSTNHSDVTSPIVEPFDLPAMPTWSGVVPSKWGDLQARFLSDVEALAACRSGASGCSQAAHRFLSIVDLGRKRRGRARLGWINRAVNLAIKPQSDWAQYGYADYWASPLQTLSSRAGDCEDYAIVKYAAFRELGMALDDLRLVIVRDNMRQTQHAILTVRNENEWLILDNRTMIMLTTEKADLYHPLFVMDHRGVKSFSSIAALQ